MYILSACKTIVKGISIATTSKKTLILYKSAEHMTICSDYLPENYIDITEKAGKNGFYVLSYDYSLMSLRKLGYTVEKRNELIDIAKTLLEKKKNNIKMPLKRAVKFIPALMSTCEVYSIPGLESPELFDSLKGCAMENCLKEALNVLIKNKKNLYLYDNHHCDTIAVFDWLPGFKIYGFSVVQFDSMNGDYIEV